MSRETTFLKSLMLATDIDFNVVNGEILVDNVPTGIKFSEATPLSFPDSPLFTTLSQFITQAREARADLLVAA